MLEDIGLTGKISENAFTRFADLSILSFKGNSISTKMMNFSSNPKLTRIDLSGNIFYGGISRSLLGLEALESLQLQDNGLTGPILDFNQSTTLKSFNLSNNNLTGPIPETRAVQSFGADSFSGNPGLCGPPSPIPSCYGLIKTGTAHQQAPDDGNKSDGDHRKDSYNFQRNFSQYLLIFDIVGLLIIVLLFVAYYKKVRKLKEMRKKDHDDQDVADEGISREREAVEEEKILIEEGERIKGSMSSSTQAAVGGGQERGKLIFMGDIDREMRFEMGDLLKASAEGLGKGISGNSYKAMMEGKPAVVVKRLRDLKALSSDEFTTQLMMMSNLKHPNLLPLLAYYYSKDEKIFIFRYAEKGNLFNRLHSKFNYYFFFLFFNLLLLFTLKSKLFFFLFNFLGGLINLVWFLFLLLAFVFFFSFLFLVFEFKMSN